MARNEARRYFTIEEPSSASIRIPARITRTLLRLSETRQQRAARALSPADSELRRSLAALRRAENELASLAMQTDALNRARIDAIRTCNALGRDILALRKEQAQRKTQLAAHAEHVHACARRCEHARQNQALSRQRYREALRRHERLRLGLERFAQAAHE